MPTAKGGYFLKDGTKVPSVTTIISRFRDAGGLIHWAWQMGKDGKDYRTEKDAAATAGTLAHRAMESFVHGNPVLFDAPDPEINQKAEMAYGAFREWARQTQLVITDTELPLISERYQYGGTFDVLMVNGRRSMGDYKTANALYPETLIQVVAYGKLWEETHPDKPIDGGYHVLRFDKHHGDFSHHWWGSLDEAWEAFLHLRALYDLEKILKQRSK